MRKLGVDPLAEVLELRRIWWRCWERLVEEVG